MRAAPTWEECASAALSYLIDKGEPFTADDLTALVGPPDPSRAPNGRNNAIGRMFRVAKSQGRIVVVGYVNSNSPTRNKGIIRTWQGVPRHDR